MKHTVTKPRRAFEPSACSTWTGRAEGCPLTKQREAWQEASQGESKRVRGEYGGVEDPQGPAPCEQGPFPALLSSWCCPLGILLVIEMMPAAAFTEPFFFAFFFTFFFPPPSPLQETYIRCLTRSVWKSCGQGRGQPWTLQPDCQDPAGSLPSHVTLYSAMTLLGPAGSSSSVGGGR